MIQVHSKVIDLILAAFLMFLVPMQYFNHIEAITRELQVHQVTVSFVENICTHGYLSKQMYENYVRELQETNQLFTIEIEYQQQVVEPVYQLSASGGSPVFTGDVITYFLIMYTDEIIEVLYSDRRSYEMNRGDQIQVVLRVNSNLRDRNVSSIQLSNGMEESGTIYTSYTGKIRDVQ